MVDWQFGWQRGYFRPIFIYEMGVFILWFQNYNIIYIYVGGKTMLDLKFVRENPEVVKENIRKKFQHNKLELVDKVIALDAELRNIKPEADNLRAMRNKISKQIGGLMAQGKKEKQKN